ncbi:DUF58 domain-containing protein [Brevibacillus dissolubilis]|uniref:DUF58 domain-containing protein n=1 Tax=Brevibacillus dissolubilis TaxID=1844116 RepID=UPI001116A2B9|nr:DUF58 domain-containing protein [Brevibacillus dissolubilis]
MNQRKQRNYGKLTILALVIVTYVFAKFQGGFASWFLFYSCVTFVGYEVLAYLLMFATLEVTREIDRNRLKDGEDVIVTLRLRRRVWFPLGWNLVVEGLPERLAGYYEPHKQLVFPWFRREIEVRYVIPNVPRGYYQLGECQVQAGDYFGFVQRSKKYGLHNEFLVYPAFRSLNHWSTGDGRISGNVQVAHRRSDDISAVRGVREYQLGDRLSQIHWRASARGTGLKTKEFEHQAMNQIVFFLDAQKANYEGKNPQLFETAVKLTASLIYYASRRMYPFGFVARSRERIALPPGNTQAHFFRVFDQLARVMPEGEEPFSRVVVREAMEFPPGFAITVITPSLDKRLVMQLMELGRMGKDVQLFWVHANVVPTLEEKEALRLLASTKIISHSVHLDEYEELKRVGGA